MPIIPSYPEITGITQGYLPNGERLRWSISETERILRFFITHKSGSGLVRTEDESELDAISFNNLWQGVDQSKIIQKIRYRAGYRNLTWEIDHFWGLRFKNLILCEVELSQPEQIVDIPMWLAPYIDREVTNEKEYSNEYLAQR